MTHERTEHAEARPELDRRQGAGLRARLQRTKCDRENAWGADDRVGIRVRQYPRRACGAVILVVPRA